MGIKLPINEQYRLLDRFGRDYLIQICIEQSTDLDKYYPDGVTCAFRVLREISANHNEYELILLIDNHAPFGFHVHNKLPEIHDSRIGLHIKNWKEAWDIFDIMTKEIINEA